ncbi:VOC family protein [Planctomycetota bacterium]|nr:VOC family protein [Planctomycetota bacterium]
MIKQLAHLCILTKDLEKSRWFYCEVLGLEEGFVFKRDEKPIGFYVKLGENTFIEVFKGEVVEQGNIRHMAIEVEDMDGVIARIREHGVEVSNKTMGADHSWQAWVIDPDGNEIEFHEYTKESLQLRGGVCQVNWQD